MTKTAMAAPFVENDFRVGRVIGRTMTIYSQHFVIFFVVALVAARMTYAHRTLAAVAVGVGAAAFVLGMVVAVLTDNGLY